MNNQTSTLSDTELDHVSGGDNWAVLGAPPGADIEAIGFLVLMSAAKSAQDDVRAAMGGATRQVNHHSRVHH